MTAPIQRPGKSKQDYSTPAVFLEAIRKQFGNIVVDLSASHENKVAEICITEAEDALATNWNTLHEREDVAAAMRALGGDSIFWLNPPYGDITPWVHKCATYRGPARILTLLPASVGSNWYYLWCENYAEVYFLAPRLSFDGKAPYPKDLMLCVYNKTCLPAIHQARQWRWKEFAGK